MKEAYTRHDCIKCPYKSHGVEQRFEKMQFLKLTFFLFLHIGNAMINPGLIQHKITSRFSFHFYKEK